MRKQNRKCSSSGPQVFVWADGSNRGQVREVAKMGVKFKMRFCIKLLTDERQL